MAKKKADENLLTLTGSDGVDYTFEPIELFKVGKKSFALLRPTEGPKNELTILKFKLDAKGQVTSFEDPSKAEFDAAVAHLDALSGPCGCEDEGCGCEDEAATEGESCCCCGCEEPEPKPAKKAAKKAPAKKAPAKKVAAKKAVAKKPAAKKAAKAPAKKAKR